MSDSPVENVTPRMLSQLVKVLTMPKFEKIAELNASQTQNKKYFHATHTIYARCHTNHARAHTREMKQTIQLVTRNAHENT